MTRPSKKTVAVVMFVAVVIGLIALLLLETWSNDSALLKHMIKTRIKRVLPSQAKEIKMAHARLSLWEKKLIITQLVIADEQGRTISEGHKLTILFSQLFWKPIITRLKIEKPILNIYREEDKWIPFSWKMPPVRKITKGKPIPEIELQQGQIAYWESSRPRPFTIKNVTLVFSRYLQHLQGKLQTPWGEKIYIQGKGESPNHKQITAQGRGIEIALDIQQHEQKLTVLAGKWRLAAPDKWWEKLSLPFLVSWHSSQGRFQWQRNNNYWQYQTQLKNLVFHHPNGGAIKKLSGNIALQGEVKDKHHLAQGRWQNGRLGLEKAEFEQIQSQVQIKDFLLSLKDIDAFLYDGKVTGDFHIYLNKKHAFQSQLEVVRAKLSRWAKEGLKRNLDIKGDITGKIYFQKNFYQNDPLQGQGKFRLYNGDLWGTEIFSAIFRILPLEREPSFNSGEIHFYLKADHAKIQQVELSSSVLKLQGQGSIDWQGKLDLRITSNIFPDFGPDIPWMGELWGAVKKNLFAFSLSGSLKNPIVSYAGNLPQIEKPK